MGQDEDSSTPARRLKLLEGFIAPGRTGGDAARTAPTATSRPAAVLDVIDHMHASVDEVITYTRAHAPGARRPADLSDIYDWAREHTADLAPADQRARETLIYRQSLEHAIQMGDTKVVRPHPCPACGCFGLQWMAAMRRAVCTNLRCVDADGMTTAWTLRTLAKAHIARQESRYVRAT